MSVRGMADTSPVKVESSANWMPDGRPLGTWVLTLADQLGKAVERGAFGPDGERAALDLRRAILLHALMQTPEPKGAPVPRQVTL